ncbi:MAG: LysR family transcriptional regulator [Rhodocyclales bacterium]|nr:LysR family transcriptional regulator [Rhodocyclales bacterium]
MLTDREIPNLRHLRAFGEVAACRSISQASTRVFLSQPAITQAIAKLERQLQMTLFERHSDGMHPTEAGRLFAGRVARALELIRDGGLEATRIGAERGGRRQASLDQLVTTTQLRSLIAVANARNFSLAARAIGTSQPALHRAARDLEALMDIRLFEKTSQGIELTRAAQSMVQQVKLAFAELAQGFAEVEALRGVDAGLIVVGSMPLARHSILPAAINALARLQPEVRVNVVDAPYGELLHGLRHGELDLLIGALREPVPVEDVVQEALFGDPLAIVARSGHPLAKKKRITVADLAAYPWVLPRRGTPTRDHFDALFDGSAPPRGGLVESSSVVLICGLLLDSDRLTLISRQQVLREEEQGLLTTLPYDMSRTRRPIGLTTRRNWRPTATQSRFLDLVRAAAGAVRQG